MKILLDTHIFICWDIDPRLMSASAKKLCDDPNNTLVISIATVWEMQIKAQSGKLELRLPLRELIQNQIETNGVELLPIILDHVLALQNLPPHHKDPFDRLLIAQARHEGWPLLSADTVFENYDLELLK
jgi:PIN domain nuclease of toxin-antitoxin system